MPYVVKKAIQDYAKKKNVQVSGDFYVALDKKIEKLLDTAATRTKDNKRKTLKPYDL
jgi:histone H3/H4